MLYSRLESQEPHFKQINVSLNLPESLRGMEEMIKNLWWTWDIDASDLFMSMDDHLWKISRYNPKVFLEAISYKKLLDFSEDPSFINRFKMIYERFLDYMDKKPDCDSTHIAYFSMEYGLTDILKTYSGGLGILAGDYLKEASDRCINMVGVGLLYRYGYFKQQLSTDGDQLHIHDYQNFSNIPVNPVKDENGNHMILEVNYPGWKVYAKIWEVKVGRVSLYLMDTDFEMNSDLDRFITHFLYGGDNENRLKQEYLLGLGGIMLLNKLGIKSEIYHCNEGHAAFISVERIKDLIEKEKFLYEEAVEYVRSTTLFTTHTPVPAGHDVFPDFLINTYFGWYVTKMGITMKEFLRLGKVNPDDHNEKFSMSILAITLSAEVNGVSMLHGKVSRSLFKHLWKGYFSQELFIGHVTNGVHVPTWTAKEWRELYNNTFGPDFDNNQIDFERWGKIYGVDDEKIWDIREKLRGRLIDYIKSRMKENWVKRHENPQDIVEVQKRLSKKCLTIGFARRFATYKRAALLFSNTEKLSKILNNPDKPVQLIFAGKAHPADVEGQKLIKQIIDVSKKPEFKGKVLFLENYDMELAKKLISGVDIWMNTPTRLMEASGTSGEKAVMNGVLHFSVLDGWWVEGYKKDAGWAIREEQTFDNNDFQNALDAEEIYNILENEIIPAFYQRSENDVPVRWVGFIKKCIAEVSRNFTTSRMIHDYQIRYYKKLSRRFRELKENNFDKMKELTSWKKKIVEAWDKINVVGHEAPVISGKSIVSGETYTYKLLVDLNGLEPQDLVLEHITVKRDYQGEKTIRTNNFLFEEMRDTIAVYSLTILMSRVGNFECGVRIFPTHGLLAHRQDFPLVKWVNI
ncbi:MAG: alpha-glucan family phosphorylase [Candidatus Delongbacteria bacterium]|nr:alpha-glucan family phosphorylase [Candidatus Delongbacteria bacterium]MBN2835045.1 alpha-glucan family phosphorylase [Candidatus Delongbacteria bacterium]